MNRKQFLQSILSVAVLPFALFSKSAVAIPKNIQNKPKIRIGEYDHHGMIISCPHCNKEGSYLQYFAKGIYGFSDHEQVICHYSIYHPNDVGELSYCVFNCETCKWESVSSQKFTALKKITGTQAFKFL